MKKKCIQLQLEVADDWEFENLLLDVKCGLFEKRFRNFLRKKGHTIEGELTIKLEIIKENETTILYSNSQPTSGVSQTQLVIWCYYNLRCP